MPKLEYFYDYVSVYSYLADHVVSKMLEPEVVYRPMLLGAVMQATDNRPPALVPAKGRHLRDDVHRWVEHYGIPFKFNSIFPQKTLSALRLAIEAQRRGTFAMLHPRLFEAAFVTDRDLSDTAVLASILSDADLPADDYLQAIAEQSVKDELKANTEEAIARGAFGAPTFFVDEEMFFGNDRFEFIREALSS